MILIFLRPHVFPSWIFLPYYLNAIFFLHASYAVFLLSFLNAHRYHLLLLVTFPNLVLYSHHAPFVLFILQDIRLLMPSFDDLLLVFTSITQLASFNLQLSVFHFFSLLELDFRTYRSTNPCEQLLHSS